MAHLAGSLRRNLRQECRSRGERTCAGLEEEYALLCGSGSKIRAE